MLRSLNSLTGYRLIASDGDIGHGKDFLFDDDRWALRYLVADTGSWLLSRKVLVSPIFLDPPSWEAKGIPVRLTRQQIEESPPLDSDAPVSRRYERAYHDFFAAPYYWMGDGLWGGFGYPGLMVPPTEATAPELPGEDPEGSRLRSAREIIGYGVSTRDGDAGHIGDLIVDDDTWAIRYLVLDTSRLPFSKKVLIAVEWVEGLSWTDRRFQVDLGLEQVETAPAFDPERPVNEEQETVLYDFYGRPRGHVSERPKKS